jgi:hypothetical protein
MHFWMFTFAGIDLNNDSLTLGLNPVLLFRGSMSGSDTKIPIIFDLLLYC